MGTVSYTYDAASRRASITVTGQPTVAYGYDNADRLTSITQGSSVVSFTYDTTGRRTTLTLTNGVITEYAYDAASRLTGLTYKKGPNTLGALTSIYDANGNRRQVGGTWSRTGLPQPLASATYDAGNRQLTFGTQTLTYDFNGNLTSDGANTYTWDARNQLAAISGSSSASLAYDALGWRRQKTLNGGTTTFLYDGLNPVQEDAGGGVTNLLAGLSLDEFLLRSDAAGAQSLLADSLGSIIAMTDGAGTVSTEYTYEPFGATTATGASTPNELQFTGRENDGTGLYYHRARYYHPALQRFISEDPIGLAAGDVNFYVYVANNPLSFIDPLGLDKDQCSGGGGGLVAAANFSAGFGDILTSGLGLSYAVGLPSGTEGIRKLWLEAPGLPTSGALDVVNPKCSWAYTAGQVAGAADAIAIVGLSTAAVAAGLQTRIAIHGPHHTFGPLGRLAHVQINWWRIGVKGSGGAIRIPLPWR